MAQRLLVSGDQAGRQRRHLTTNVDTIFALSSGALPSGVAVVRVSGPQAFAALTAIAGPVPPARVATLRILRDGDLVLDRALVLAFPAPGSATGEDVAEFHVHGGPAVVAALLDGLSRQTGLRAARAGEFTRRAFDSGRLDLTQAEGLADLVAAETEAQRRAAVAQSGGVLRARVDAWRETLLDLLAEAEAGLDFADGEADVAARLPDADAARLIEIGKEMRSALADADRATALRDGLNIVVTGPPNVGKSSLVNALSQRDVAIVSPVPGTTRDALEVRMDLGGVLVTLVDTAGLRDSTDPVEAEGISRARARAATADLVLELYNEGAARPGEWAVRTMADLRPAADGFAVSSLTGQGLPELLDRLTAWAQAAVRPAEPPLIARARQRDEIAAAYTAVTDTALASDPVLRAEALRSAAAALGAVTGAVGVEAVLDRIFSRFCIGK